MVVDQGDLSQRVHLSNRRMLHLVKRAKVQLIKIDQQKLLKSSQVRRRAGDSQTKPLECFSELWTWCTCGIQLLLSDWSVALCRCHNFDYSLLVYDAVGGVQRSGRRQTEEEEEEGEGSKPRWHNSGEGFFLSFSSLSFACVLTISINDKESLLLRYSCWTFVRIEVNSPTRLSVAIWCLF